MRRGLAIFWLKWRGPPIAHDLLLKGHLSIPLALADKVDGFMIQIRHFDVWFELSGFRFTLRTNVSKVNDGYLTMIRICGYR